MGRFSQLSLSWARASLSLGILLWAGPSPAQIQPALRAVELKVNGPDQVGFSLLEVEQTGLTFTNELDAWAGAENRVLHNGSGVAVGDYDRDGWEDLFLASLSGANRLYRNLGGWRFADVTEQVGLRFRPGPYRGGVFADVNGDGWLDLLVGTVGAGVLCYLNDSQGRLVEATARAGTASSYAAQTLTLADVDGDGRLDLYVANNRTDDIRDWLRIPVMLVNRQPVVPPALRDRIRIEKGQLLEYGEPDFFYRSEGLGRFSPVPWTQGAFLNERGEPLTEAPLDWGLTAAFRDLNHDGAPDLYVCNDYWTPDRIWLNLGDGRFQAVDALAVRKTTFSSMCVDFADINRDGHLDIFVSDMLSRTPELRKRQMIAKRKEPAVAGGDLATRLQTARNTLLLNRGDGTYAEIAHLAGLEASEWTWCPLFLDVDLDGYDDLLISAGHFRDVQDLDANEKVQSLQKPWHQSAQGTNVQQAFVAAKLEHTRLYPSLRMPVIAYHNRGDLRFEETTRPWGLDHPGVNHGMAAADLDNDGDLDLVVNRLGDVAALFRNETTRPRLAVRLRGKPPNTQAIGATLELLNGPVAHQIQEVTAGGHYLSGSDTRRVFACGPGDLRLRVRWRDGTVTELADLKPNRLYEVDQARAPLLSHASPAPPASGGQTPPPLFENVSSLLGHTHHEDACDDFADQPLLPRRLSQAGPGVAWIDLDQDGWDDLVIGAGQGGALAVFRNQKNGRLTRASDAAFAAVTDRDQLALLGWRSETGEVAILAGLAGLAGVSPQGPCLQIYGADPAPPLPSFPSEAPSAGPLALADYDGDGDLDLFVGGSHIPGRYPEPAASLLWQREGTRWILDHQNSEVLRHAGLVRGSVWSDLDGDGHPELLLACEWGPVRVYQSQSGQLREMTARWGLAEAAGWWTGIATGDLDGDGRLDIIAGNWGLNSAYRASPAKPFTLFYGDLAGLGRVDLLECEFDSRLGGPAPLHLRDDLAPHLPFLLARFPTHRAWSVASAAEVLQGCPQPIHQLTITTLASTVFFNRGGRFEIKELPLEAQWSPALAVVVTDFDGDGFEDVFLSQNFFAFAREEDRLDAGRGLLLRGDGAGGLDPLPGPRSGLLIYGEQRGAAAADFDQDGRVDLVVAQNAAATQLFRNTGASPGLRVRLVGPPGNPQGIGAVMRLRFGEAWGPARELHAGSGYLSQDSATMVLAAPDQKSPTAIWVRWPGGRVTETPCPPGARAISVAHFP